MIWTVLDEEKRGMRRKEGRGGKRNEEKRGMTRKEEWVGRRVEEEGGTRRVKK